MKASFFKNNEPVSGLTHLAGAGLAVVGLVLMLLAAHKYGNAWHLTAFSIFGASMILLYLASFSYHITPRHSAWKKRLQRLDLAFIFILIAGTYTPIALLGLGGAWGWTIFGLVWGIAFVGVTLQIIGVKLKSAQGLAVYLAMGWLIIIAWPVLLDSVSAASVYWLLAGGVLYSIGVVFYSLDNIFPRRGLIGMHEIFHLFVLAGSFSHFWLMYRHLVYS